MFSMKPGSYHSLSLSITKEGRDIQLEIFTSTIYLFNSDDCICNI